MSILTRRIALLLLGTLLALGAAASAARAYSPPPVYQLTFKKPDLTISSVATHVVRPCPTSGAPSLRFIVKVSNVGKLATQPTQLNSGLVVKGPTHTVSADLPYIAAGSTVLVELIYNPEPSEPADYPNDAFKFKVNPNHLIIESNYDNNSYSLQVKLPAGYCNANPAMPPAPAPPSAGN